MALIFCQKLKREGEQLSRKPLPGELGDRIYQHICKDAWDLWLQQQTMLLNEYRLASFKPETQSFLQQQMEAFLFSDTDVAPKEYKPV